MNLSEKLKNAREKAGLSQKDVAEALNISRQSVSKWETGKAYPDIDNLIILSELYDVSVDYLIKNNQESSLKKTVENPFKKNKKIKVTIFLIMNLLAL